MKCYKFIFRYSSACLLGHALLAFPCYGGIALNCNNRPPGTKLAFYKGKCELLRYKGQDLTSLCGNQVMAYSVDGLNRVSLVFKTIHPKIGIVGFNSQAGAKFEFNPLTFKFEIPTSLIRRVLFGEEEITLPGPLQLAAETFAAAALSPGWHVLALAPVR